MRLDSINRFSVRSSLFWLKEGQGMSTKSTIRHETDKGNQQVSIYTTRYSTRERISGVAGLLVQKLNLGRTLRRWCAKSDRKAAPCLGGETGAYHAVQERTTYWQADQQNPYKMCINPSILVHDFSIHGVFSSHQRCAASKHDRSCSPNLCSKVDLN